MMSPSIKMRETCLVIFVGLISSSWTFNQGQVTSGNKNESTVPFPVYVSPNVDTKTVQIVQSIGVGGGSGSASINNKSSQNVSRSHYNGAAQPSTFIASQFIGFNKNKSPQLVPQRSAPTKVAPTTTTTSTTTTTNLNIPPNAQRRVDSDVADDDSEAYNNEEYEYRHRYRGGYRGGYRDDDEDENPYEDHYYSNNHHDNDQDPHQQSSDDTELPETRESPFAGFPASGPGFVGAAPFDPLPPPPTAIRGSVDYILIPLVLIGIAGPIFVVLYVILGAFEAKISPITRSMSGGIDTYMMPYLDNLMSSVGRALDGNECLDYAACQFGSFFNRLGYTDTFPTMRKTMEPFMPQPYKRKMRQIFRVMEKEEHNCSIMNCIRL